MSFGGHMDGFRSWLSLFFRDCLHSSLVNGETEDYVIGRRKLGQIA